MTFFRRLITLGNACLLACLSLWLAGAVLYAQCEFAPKPKVRSAVADSSCLRPIRKQIFASLPIIAIGAGYNVYNDNVRALRMSHVPRFRATYDDYMQFAPLAVQGALRLSGTSGQSANALQMFTSDAIATATMFAVVSAGKYLFRVERPDGSTRNSYPSGHTAMAFTSATLLHIEYGRRYPWLSILGYGAATSVGVGRVLNNRHWAGDVVTGAGIGLFSAYLGYYLSNRIFGSDCDWSHLKEDKFSTGSWSFSMSMYYGERARNAVRLSTRGYAHLTSSSLALGARYRLSPHWYLQAELMPEVYRLRVRVVGLQGVRQGHISSLAYGAGLGYRTALGGARSPLSVGLTLGAVWRHGRDRQVPDGYSFDLRSTLTPRLSCEVSYRLSSHLALRGTLAYRHSSDDLTISSPYGMRQTHSPRWVMGTSFVYSLQFFTLFLVIPYRYVYLYI